MKRPYSSANVPVSIRRHAWRSPPSAKHRTVCCQHYLRSDTPFVMYLKGRVQFSDRSCIFYWSTGFAQQIDESSDDQDACRSNSTRSRRTFCTRSSQPNSISPLPGRFQLDIKAPVYHTPSSSPGLQPYKPMPEFSRPAYHMSCPNGMELGQERVIPSLLYARNSLLLGNIQSREICIPGFSLYPNS